MQLCARQELMEQKEVGRVMQKEGKTLITTRHTTRFLVSCQEVGDTTRLQGQLPGENLCQRDLPP